MDHKELYAIDARRAPITKERRFKPALHTEVTGDSPRSFQDRGTSLPSGIWDVQVWWERGARDANLGVKFLALFLELLGFLLLNSLEVQRSKLLIGEVGQLGMTLLAQVLNALDSLHDA
jgi:hypothetical protein